MFSSSTIDIENKEGLSKLDIRQVVWKHFSDNDLANFPHSVYRRIPNFKGADEAAEKLAEMDIFKKAKSVKVNLDKPQGEVRLRTLQDSKVLLVPTPGLRTGLFNHMDSKSAGEVTPENLKLLSQNDGMKMYSKPLDLSEDVSVDLIVVGSVAVSRTGQRIGKGEGFVDLEYGMMREMKCADEKTLIVTTVHDCQVFKTLPDSVFGPHDTPVDIIVTPTEVIRVAKPHAKPQGILWDLLQADKFFRVAILRTIWQKQKDAGKTVALATDEPVPTEEEIADYWKKLDEERSVREQRPRRGRRGRGGERGVGGGERGMRRGRGGRGRRRFGDRENEEMEEAYDDDGKRIEVTVSMNKRNRIIRRSVRSSNAIDRDGVEGGEEDEEGMNGEDGERRGGRGRGRGRRRGRGYYGPPAFSIFLGNVPCESRTREIKEAVKDVIDQKIQGVDIQRKTRAGYAFLRFNRLGVEDADDLVNSLQGLKIHDQDVVVERAKDRVFKDESDGEEGVDGGYDGYRPRRGRGGGSRGRGGAGGKRYRGGGRGRGRMSESEGGYGGGENRRRTRDDDEGDEGYEFHEAKE